MAVAPDSGAADVASPGPASSRLGWETVLAVSGGLAVAGFFLPWLAVAGDGARVSGLDLVRGGGVWAGLAAIPALGLLTAIFGGLRWRAARYTGLLAALAMLVPVAYVLVTDWPWLYTIPVGLGVASVVLAKVGKAQWVCLPLGGVLLAGSIAVPLIAGDEPLFDVVAEPAAVEPAAPEEAKPEEAAPQTPGLVIGAGAVDGLGIMPAASLVGLSLLMPICAVWLLVAGLRKKGRERAVVAAGWAVVALGAYAALLASSGAMVVTGGIGLWMTAVGGCVLLVGSRPFASRRGAEAPKAEEEKPKPKAEEKAKAEPKPKPKPKPKAEEKPKPKPKPEAKTSDPADAEKAERLAKIEKLKELKRLKAQKAAKAKAAEAKAAEEEAAAEDAKAAKADAETRKAGEALVKEPEPVFAADPTAPPPPENEDRDALMKRMGVKKPPPPSDNELADMLAALKKRADVDD